MNIKDFLQKKDQDSQEFYWSLVVEEGWVQAGIWKIEEERVDMISVSPVARWETDEELVNASDSVLSAAIQKLPEDSVEPAKTVFALPSLWVKEGQIKEEYLRKIKEVCVKLSLDAVGFVVLSEAIAYLYKSEEGVPLNAIIIGVSESELEITVFKLGNPLGNFLVSRSVSVSDDLAEGLSRFAEGEMLPSRILLYNGKGGELEDMRQSLIQVKWDAVNEKIKFLHTPKIEVIDPQRKVQAASLAGASELNGAEIQVSKSPDERNENENLEFSAKADKIIEESINPKELGFVVGEDIGISETKEEKETFKPGREYDEYAHEAKEDVLSFFKKMPETFRSLARTLNKKKEPSRVYIDSSSGKKKRILVLGILFSFPLLIFSYWWFIPKADVTIYASPKKLEEKAIVFIETNSSFSAEGRILAGKIIETEVEGEKTESTLGVRTVGDKARGTIKIQNGTSSEINLSSGTILLAGDLKFVLGGGVSVSAALSPTTPGTVVSEVTAGDIGAEYNLAKDETLKVGSYSKADIDAVAVENFSGGSSRQVPAVLKEDQENLEKELKTELLDKAKSSLSQKILSTEFLVPELTKDSIKNKEFSAKIGEEASTLKLTMTLTVSAISVDKQNLTEVIRRLLKEKIPQGYIFRESQGKVSFQDLKEGSGKTEASIVISARLLPEVDYAKVAKEISGMPFSKAEDYLNHVSGFTRAEIDISPGFVSRLKRLPRMAKNISIEVLPEE